MSLILMITLFYKTVILQGEIWRWSLLGLKGLIVLIQYLLSLWILTIYKFRYN